MARQRYVTVLTTMFLILALTGCYASVAKKTQPAPTETVTPTITSTPPADTGAADVEDTVTPAPVMPLIRTSVYQGYYMAGWELEFDGGVIYADAPSGTGSELVDAYIRRAGGEEDLLTHNMAAFYNAYLSGEWLYFAYADTDEGVYNTCRINIKTLGEPEFLDVYNLFATDDYFFYCKGDDYATVDYASVYRRDADFANEKPVFTGLGDSSSLVPAGDRLVAFRDYVDNERGNALTVYNQDGAALFEVQVNSRMSWLYCVKNGVFFWCDYEPPVRVHMLNLHTGDVTDVPEASPIDEGAFHVGVADADDEWVYVEVSVPFPDTYDDELLFDNTRLYRLPLAGGELEFVRSWFES